jgi:hypothetical protein
MQAKFRICDVVCLNSSPKVKMTVSKKVQSTIKDLQTLNNEETMAIRNAKNYESVMKYFDFKRAVKAILYNQN